MNTTQLLTDGSALRFHFHVIAEVTSSLLITTFIIKFHIVIVAEIHIIETYVLDIRVNATEGYDLISQDI